MSTSLALGLGMGVGAVIGWALRGYVDSILTRVVWRLITGAIGPAKIRDTLHAAIDHNERKSSTPAAPTAGAPATLQSKPGDRP